MKPLVSILIPAYNAEPWIADSIRSAMAQTWPRKEIIVVDDGSIDRTFEIARQFESESVHVVSQKNQGAAAARNKAFSLCQGDYVQWLDADDLLAADKIARQLDVVDSEASPRILLASAWAHFIYRVNRAKFTPTTLWCDQSPAEFLIRKLGQKLHMQTSTWLVSRELTEAAGPWDTSIVSDDDGEYFCRVLLESQGIRFVQEARVYYRSLGTMSLSYVGYSDRKLNALWRSMQLHIKYLRSLEDGERVRIACLKYLQNYIIDFYPHRLDIVDQMQQVASLLGGQLGTPRLSWKYSWIKVIFGWRSAQRAQLLLPSVKWSLIRLWDKLMYRFADISSKRLASLVHADEVKSEP
jgi:glycosyltransferase involved in cell wall biosynthesis